MRSISQFYLQGQPSALDGWNGGEGQRTGGCRGKVGVATNDMPPLTAEAQAAHAVAAGWLKSVHAAQAHWSPGGRSVVRMVGLAAGSICSCLGAANDRRIRHRCLSLGAANAAE